jgi:hypothetical protein
VAVRRQRAIFSRIIARKRKVLISIGNALICYSVNLLLCDALRLVHLFTPQTVCHGWFLSAWSRFTANGSVVSCAVSRERMKQRSAVSCCFIRLFHFRYGFVSCAVSRERMKQRSAVSCCFIRLFHLRA